MNIDPFQLDDLRRQLNSLPTSKQLAEQWMAREGASLAELANNLAQTTGSSLVREAALQAQMISGLAAKADLLRTQDVLLVQELDKIAARVSQICTAEINQAKSLLDQVIVESNRMSALVRERFQSLQFRLPQIAPLWDDLIKAQNGDRNAAERVSARIS